jgi:hypothetical protein
MFLSQSILIVLANLQDISDDADRARNQAALAANPLLHVPDIHTAARALNKATEVAHTKSAVATEVFAQVQGVSDNS